MYKDQEKQKEANRQAQARFRAKGITEGITNLGITDEIASQRVTPKKMSFADLPPDVRHNIERVSQNPTQGLSVAEEKAKRTAAAIKYHTEHPGAQHKGIDPDGDVVLPPDYKPAADLKRGEYNQVSKPGDKDYGDSGVLEKCRLCGVALPPLQQPRRYQGMCLACVSGGVKV